MDSPMKTKRATVAAGPSAAPDGGHAWFILLSCFLVFGLTFGVIKSFGVFFVEIHHYFKATATETSWITSIAVAVIHIIAPIASALSAHFSHRSVVMMGGLICSVGAVTGSFATNLLELYLTVGLLDGFGCALTWTPTVTMLGLYFDRRRPVANAIASSGECILTFVLTPLFQLLIDSYSWRGAMLILGGLQLNLCVCGLLLRPLEAPGHSTLLNEGVGQDLLTKVDLDRSKRSRSEDQDPKQAGSTEGGAEEPRLMSGIRRYVDFTLMTNPHFIVYSLFGMFAALGFFAPALFLVPYARSKGIEEYQAVLLMSISAAMDLFGRLFFGWVANLRLVETVKQLTVTVILLGTVLLLCPLASTFVELAAFSAAYGLVFGATVAVHITVLAEVVGVHRLGSALGLFMLIRSSTGLLGPPMAGFFIDKMSDYGTGFLMAGVALIVSALFLLLLRQMNRRGQGSRANNPSVHTDNMGQSQGAEA